MHGFAQYNTQTYMLVTSSAYFKTQPFHPFQGTYYHTSKNKQILLNLLKTLQQFCLGLYRTDGEKLHL